MSLYSWKFNTSLNQFTTAPAIARAHLRKNGKVLDLCCGDGSISYLFFSDIAQKIDAVDINDDAIRYASRTYFRNNISYRHTNIFQFLQSHSNDKYDLIYFGSGFDYFSNEQRVEIYKLVIHHMFNESFFILKTPIWNGTQYMYVQDEAQSDFANKSDDVYTEVNKYFDIFFSKEVEYIGRTECILVAKLKKVKIRKPSTQ